MKTGVIIFSTTLCIFAALSVSAQSKFFSTSSRGGAEGAKQSAQVSTLQGENERMNACTAVGRIYAPTHPNRDANDCIQHLTLDPATGTATFTNGVTINSGGATVSGNSTFSNNLAVGGAATISSTLNVTGASTFGSNMTVNGRVTAGQLFVGSGNVGAIPTCTSAQKLQWNGTAWTCVTDNIGATAATESDPKVGTLTNGRWCRTDGTRVHCDVAAPPACGTAQKLQWNGSAWSCVADGGDNLGAGGETPGHITIRNAAPTLFLADSDNRSGMVHVNSNIMYFLRGCGTGSTSWCAHNGWWPLYLNLENNQAVFGDTVNTQDVYIRKIGKWASELSGSGTGSSSCAAGWLYWGNACSHNRTASGAHGQGITVTSGGSCWTHSCGQATFTCNNGIWVIGSNSCYYCDCSGGDFGDW